MITLDRLPQGAIAAVRKLSGGKELKSRLSAMGLTEGAHLTVLQNRGNGPVLVKVRDTRIALGRGEAIKVLVEQVAA
ncbi:MAG: FeoA family protein [Pseudomonadota bacterium]